MFTYLGALKGRDKYKSYWMPRYDSPEDGWEMINNVAGPIGEWDHEIVVPYSDGVYLMPNLKYLDGSIHIKGELGPNGELPVVSHLNATHGYSGNLRQGGIFIENVKANSVGVPNDKYFFVLHNVHLEDWSDHAFITSAGAKHLYVELVGCYLGKGRNNHAAYIDNVAFAHIKDCRIESPGRGHALRSVAQAGLYQNVRVSNIQLDGTILDHPEKDRKLIGMAPLEIYVNGRHTVKDCSVVYYRANASSAYGAVNFRSREAINSLDRYPVEGGYEPLVWGTLAYEDPITWDFAPLDSLIDGLDIVCLGEQPAHAFNIKSTYPYLHDAPKSELALWWAENEFDTWGQVLENSHPSWHGTLNLISHDKREFLLERRKPGWPNKIPFSVPSAWEQKARLIIKKISGNYTELYSNVEDDDRWWCVGEINSGACFEQAKYKQADVIFYDEPSQPEPDTTLPEDYEYPAGGQTEVSQCDIETAKLDGLIAQRDDLVAALDSKEAEIAAQQDVVDQACAAPPPEPDPAPTLEHWSDSLKPYVPAVGEVKLIPGTSFEDIALQHDGSPACDYLRVNGGNVINAWVGMGFDSENGVVRILSPGGHADGGANAVYRFDVKTLAWHRDYDYAQPKPPWPSLVDSDGDGKCECVGLVDGPMASHSYDGVVYIPSISATLIMGTSGFYPNWKDENGNYCDRKAVEHTWWLWHDDGRWEDLGIPSEAYVRCVYDVTRDRVYYTSKQSDFMEINPHTWEITKLANVWPHTTGSTMTMSGRDVYFTVVNGGFYRARVEIDGTTGPVEALIDYPSWENKGWGLAPVGNYIVGWDGDKSFMLWDTTNNSWEIITASGDTNPSSTERVYSKFIGIPEIPGLCLGVTKEGIVLCKVF